MARESIETLLNPSLKVSRPVSACKKCRMAKIKCDGKLPACSACERAGKAKECSSANDEFARGKERSYVSALEIAAQRLQRKLEERRAQASMSGGDSVVMFSHDGPTLQKRPISLTRRKEAGSVDELVSDFGFLTVNATSRDFQGFSSTMSFALMLKAIAMKQELPTYAETSLPPRHSTTTLIDHYFDNFHVLLPFLSETQFQSVVSRLYQEQPNSSKSPMDIWCFRLVLAISSASLCQMRGDEHDANALHNLSVAVEVMEQVIHPGSIAGLQALLLLTQFSLVDPEYFDNWYLVGMAAKLMVDMGLHCEPAPETKISKHVLDERRRVFYCTYALDRLISMALGFAFSFTDDSAPNVLLPTLAIDQEARSPSQLFTRSVRPSLFLFDIRRVQSAYYQLTRWSSRKEWTAEAANTYISSTLEDVQAWYSSLPSSFSQIHLQTFYLEYLYTQALVLSPNQVMPVKSISDAHKAMFFHCAIQYSELLQSMVARPDIQNCLNYSDFCRARFVSRQFKNIMWSSFDVIIRGEQTFQPSNQILSPLESCNRSLSFLNNISQILEYPEQRWGISALKEIFEQESAVLLARLQRRQQEYSTQQLAQPSNSFGLQPQCDTVTVPGVPFTNTSPPPAMSAPSMHYSPAYYGYNPSLTGMPGSVSNDSTAYPDPGMHRPNPTRVSEWDPNSGQANPELPPGSLPRRTYQFTGGQS